MSGGRPIERLRRGYVAAALIVFNALLLFVALNLAAAIARRLWHRAKGTDQGRMVRTHGIEHVAKAYPGWKREDLVAMLEETVRADRYEYEPYTAFRVTPARGRFVNVTAAGYRENGRPATWPPRADRYNVFVFGGSTTFGVGLPDDQTISAALERVLGTACGKRVAVYNFGRPAYFSVQESMLFQRLLRAGLRPDLAIFIDGLNDFGYREPAMTPSLTRMVRATYRGGVSERFIDFAVSLPLAKLPFLNRLDPHRDEPIHTTAGLPPAPLVERWLATRRSVQAIARDANVATLFVWQPIPTYRYDTRFHLFADAERFRKWRTPEGYAMMDGLRRAGRIGGDDFLWLADLQQGRRENLYVDDFHYDAKFCAVIAGAVADAVRARPCPAP